MAAIIVQAHNISQCIGWSIILGMTLCNIRDSETGAFRMDQYWNVPHFKQLLDIFQCLQVLDVIFSALKWTNNNVMTTLI
jgi:hypothetical protein